MNYSYFSHHFSVEINPHFSLRHEP